MHFLLDGWPAMGRSSFFLMQVMVVMVEAIVFTVGRCVRNNLIDLSLFCCMSKVCLFF